MLGDLWPRSHLEKGSWVNWAQVLSQPPEESWAWTGFPPDVKELCQVIIAGNGRGCGGSVQTGLTPFWFRSHFVDFFHSPVKDLPCINLHSLKNEKPVCLFV